MSENAMDYQLEQMLKANSDRAWDARMKEARARAAKEAKRRDQMERVCRILFGVTAAVSVLAVAVIVAM